MSNVILICGLNGAGKSTLAKALAGEIGYRFIDIEDVYFPKDNPEYLYANPRSFEEVEAILADTFSEKGNFVLASVRGNFKEEITRHFKCVIHIDVPKEVRLKRVYERSFQKFGERMCEGGDLYEREQSFLERAKSRDENMVTDWLESLSCPVLRVDGKLPIAENVKLLAPEFSPVLVHYCHPNCKPFQNIMRLPKEEAFKFAGKMAAENPDTTAFYRFADFENYYPRRQKTDEILYRNFIAMGGKPVEEYPLSFVLEGGDSLQEWFGNGTVYRIPLCNVPSEAVSFALGDSCVQYERNGKIRMLTKEQLLEQMAEFDGDFEAFKRHVLQEPYSYVEAQIWDDRVVSQASDVRNGTEETSKCKDINEDIDNY